VEELPVASEDGDIRIDSGNASPIRNMLTGETYGAGPHITLKLARGQIRLLEIGPSPK